MAERLDNCPLCGSSRIEGWIRASDPHYGIPGSHALSRCRECTVVFVNPMYSDDELKSLYPEDYYAYHDEVRSGRFKAWAKKVLGYWQGTRDARFNPGQRILDVGCGAGDFLVSMREKGCSVHGVEISESAVRRARQRGLEVFCGGVLQAPFAEGSFDYIRASHSFEHMTRPHETLEAMRRLLKPEGKLLLAVPNYESVPARVSKRSWYHLCPPVHAFQYSVNTLTRLLAMHDFQVTRVVFNSHYAGVLGSFQIWRNRNTQRRSFEGSAFNNRALRVLSGWIEKALDAFHCGDMIEITAVKIQKRRSARAA